MIKMAGACEVQTEIPEEILSNPALLFLFYRIEQILGIKTGYEALKKLNEYLESSCGYTFTENPASFDHLLSSREHIFNLSKFITINETYFFRESVHFDLLSKSLDEYSKLGRTLNICCAAVSIGCEAYSIAMLLEYYIQRGLKLDYSIDAFDINSDSIEIAKTARYTSNTIRNDGSSYKYILDSYLIKDNNEYIVPVNIQRKIRFFPHNIMRGLDKQYDIIFFRNALIYFSSGNRFSVINNLANSLNSNGLLFLGISETSSIKHPLLESRFLSEAFYFQKSGYLKLQDNTIDITLSPSLPVKTFLPKQEEIPIDCSEIDRIIKTDDGKSNAELVKQSLENNEIKKHSGGSLTSSVIYFLNNHDLDTTDKIITYLENNNSSALTRFLRGEYFYFCGITENAEKFYHEASVKDKYFWPAFYRIAVLAASGNPVRHEYKIAKTIESIELWSNLPQENRNNYECFMGGFSPDYFKRILEKKLG